MSIEETKTKLMMLKDVLTRIESINNALDELPRIFIATLAIIAVAFGVFTVLVIIYILTTHVITTLPSVTGLLVIIALLLAVPYYVYTRIDKAMRSVNKYEYWDEKLQSVSGILEVLSTLDFDNIEYKINRVKVSYIFIIVIKLLALSIMLFLIIAAAISALIMFLGYTNWTWYTMAMAIIIDAAITLALEWEGIVNDVRRLRSLNGLIIELRWLYHELQGIQA